MASRCTNVLPCGLPKHSHSHVTPGHDPPPCHTYIYIDNYTDQRLILLTTISCHLSAIQWVTKMLINMFRQSRCLIRDALLVIFLNGYVTGMTEMTKEMESRTWEELVEVYRSVVIPVICVIFNEDVLWIVARLISIGLSGNIWVVNWKQNDYCIF